MLGWRLSLGMAVLVVGACGPRKPPLVAVFPREVTVYVAVSDEVAKSDDPGVAAMVDAIEADLREEGRVGNIVPARLGDELPLPRVELQVVNSRSASKQLQGAGRLVALMTPVALPLGLGGAVLGAATGGHMEVDAFIVAGDGTHPHYLGRYVGGSFGSSSESDNAAGEEVGHDIVESLYR